MSVPRGQGRVQLVHIVSITQCPACSRCTRNGWMDGGGGGGGGSLFSFSTCSQPPTLFVLLPLLCLRHVDVEDTFIHSSIHSFFERITSEHLYIAGSALVVGVPKRPPSADPAPFFKTMFSPCTTVSPLSYKSGDCV